MIALILAIASALPTLQVRFDLSICRQCPEIRRCPVQAAKRDGQFARFQ
jgi:hypothetical protein